MRLLTIRNYTERYGSEGHLLRVAIGVARKGWDVHAAFPQTNGTASMVRDCISGGIHYHPFEVRRARCSFPKGAAAAVKLYKTIRLLKVVNPDVVQVTLGWPTEAFGFVLACGLLKIPALVVFQLAPHKIELSPLVINACAWARTRNQLWVTVSKHNSQFLCESFRIPQEQMKLIYNGIETKTEFTDRSPEQVKQIRRDFRCELGLAENSRLLLTTGRLSLQKGHFDLMEVIDSIVREFPEVRFVWAGTGEEKDNLVKRVQEKGLEEYVLFLGYRTDILRLLKASDLFVFPTRFEGGCSSSIREAMVHELPIVSSNASGIPEIVEHKQHGLLFPVGDRKEMLASIRWALMHPHAMQEMAWNARQRIQQFSTERMVQDYMEAFEELCLEKKC